MGYSRNSSTFSKYISGSISQSFTNPTKINPPILFICQIEFYANGKFWFLASASPFRQFTIHTSVKIHQNFLPSSTALRVLTVEVYFDQIVTCMAAAFRNQLDKLKLHVICYTTVLLDNKILANFFWNTKSLKDIRNINFVTWREICRFLWIGSSCSRLK